MVIVIRHKTNFQIGPLKIFRTTKFAMAVKSILEELDVHFRPPVQLLSVDMMAM